MDVSIFKDVSTFKERLIFLSRDKDLSIGSQIRPINNKKSCHVTESSRRTDDHTTYKY